MGKKISLPFEDAREFIRTQCIGSRKQYQEWHLANQPKKIPRYPNRAYADEWKGWNNFLGTNNLFDNKKRSYRPLAEAIAWAHKLNLKTSEEWFKYYRANKIPEDIPGRPDLVYEDWLSWMHFLGNRPRQKVEAQQEVLKSSTVFYIIQEKEFASQTTIFTFGIEKGGVSAMKEWWNMSKNFKIIKLFEYDDSQMENVQKVLSNLSTAYYGSEKIRIVPNINELIWQINNFLMFAQVR